MCPFFRKSPEKLGLDHLRTYPDYLLTTRKLSPGSVENHVAALRFLYLRTLKRYEFREYIPYPRVRKNLPSILGKEEVAQLINASGTLFHRTLLRVVYAKKAIGGSQQVLRNLSRYTHRIAISNHRLIRFDGERVTSAGRTMPTAEYFSVHLKRFCCAMH